MAQSIDKTTVLSRMHLDSHFAAVKDRLRPPPKRGWIAEIRTALLMTTAQLARRLKIPQSNVSIFEKAERNKTITLRSLERIAEALDCDLHYVLVPKRSLKSTLSDRVKKLYEHDQKLLEHHMRLEGQGTKTDNRRALEMAMYEIKKDKRLWEDLE